MQHTSNPIFELSRRDLRIVTPDWAVADSCRLTRAWLLGRRESWRGADPSRSGGGGGSPALATTVQPRTRVRVWQAARAEGQIDAFAWSWPLMRRHACVYMGARARAGAEATIQSRGGAWSSTCWSYRRRCRVAPASSGYWYPGDKAKTVTRSCGDGGVRCTPHSLFTLCFARVGGACWFRADPCHRARGQCVASRHRFARGAPPWGWKPQDRRRICHRAFLITFKRFEGDTVWCSKENAAYDWEWPVGDLATQSFGSDGMSNG